MSNKCKNCKFRKWMKSHGVDYAKECPIKCEVQKHKDNCKRDNL